jgi:hypothetical protein
MSHLVEIAARCAVSLKKSENMRVSASKLVVEAVEYLKTDAGSWKLTQLAWTPTCQGSITW